jgi:glycosyltransferase involved in cell wall biosynthesis
MEVEMKVAIVYDRVNKWGGAERVLLALHELFPDAPLYTSVYSPEKALWAKVFPKVVPSFLQQIPLLKSYHELLGWLMPLAYESFNFDEYELVISVTSEAAKGIITKPSTFHLCYCLTPTRYLWSGYDHYLENPPSRLSWIPFYKYISKPFLSYTKAWDKIAAQRPDEIISISDAVRSRVKKYYNRDSKIVFPLVDIDKFKANKSKTNKNPEVSILVHPKGVPRLPGRGFDDGYFLVVSRLVPYKRVDLVIETFNRLNLPLLIVGTGSEERRLKRMAKKNIAFAGFVSEEELVDYYRSAKALIFPQEEDFGITAVEAQAAGIPVIAYKSGGALETVIDGKTGIFFSKQTIDSLIKAVMNFKTIKFKRSDMLKNAEKYSKSAFKKKFLELTKH